MVGNFQGALNFDKNCVIVLFLGYAKKCFKSTKTFEEVSVFVSSNWKIRTASVSLQYYYKCVFNFISVRLSLIAVYWDRHSSIQRLFFHLCKSETLASHKFLLHGRFQDFRLHRPHRSWCQNTFLNTWRTLGQCKNKDDT